MKKFCVLLFLILGVLIFQNMFFIRVSAHEIFVYNDSPVTLTRSSSSLRYNADNVSSSSVYKSVISTAASQFNTSCTSLSSSSFNSSNVDFSTMSEWYWNEYYGGTQIVPAYTWLYSDETHISSEAVAYYSNREITTSHIYFNPHHTSGNIWAPVSSELRTKIVVHELGHAFCIGHSDGYSPTTTNSVMYHDPAAYNENSYSLTSHDLADLNNKY